MHGLFGIEIIQERQRLIGFCRLQQLSLSQTQTFEKKRLSHLLYSSQEMFTFIC
jgi:hypothetical protein